MRLLPLIESLNRAFSSTLTLKGFNVEIKREFQCYFRSGSHLIMFADQLQQRRGEMEMRHDRLNGWNSAKYDTVCNYEPVLEVFNRQTLHIR